MEIKNILGKINQNQEEPKKFFAIEIGYEVVKTAVWHVQDKATQIVSVGSIEEWKDDSEDTLVSSIDKSLSIATKDIDPEPNEVIFGLPESWVGSDGIAESKKSYLKSITQKLDLKPVGFVVTTEAIVHHLKLKEGGPPSTILVSLTEAEAIVCIVKQGEILGSHVVGRSDDLCKDVEEGLARFGDTGDLPSRIIIYDGNIDLESAKQTLINYDWQDSINFLHFPKIEDLDAHSTITAIAIAGGTEVAKSLGIQIKEPENDKFEEEPLESPPAQELASNVPNPQPNPELIDPSEFGFADPRKTDQENLETSSQITPKEGDNFHTVQSSEIITQEEDEDEIAVTDKPEIPTKQKFHFKLPSLPKFSSKKSTIKKRIKVPLIIPLGIGILVLGFIGAVFAYWQLPKAEITIYTKPKEVEKEISFNLNSNQEILDVQNLSIPASEESIELEGEKENPTTGSKIVGERAKGKVNVFNLTQSAKTFEAGTKLNYDKYIFTTDEAVTIASATAEISSDYKTTVTPSQESVSITASNIGDQYNFSTGTELTVGSFAKSSFVAKATSDFKGGFSREIQAVSKDDQTNLKAELLEELKNQGISNLSVIASQKKGVVELEKETIENETFSADVGDEKDLLRLVLKFKLPIFTYQLADVGLLLENKYASDFPNNFKIDPENIQVEVLDASINEDGSVAVNAKVKINLTPQLDPEEIKNSIKGKYPDITRDYFKNLPSFSRVETKFSFSLPDKLQTFPRVADNITVNIKLDSN